MIPPVERDEALDRILQINSHLYEGGVNGTCWGCPYASPPLRSDGSAPLWDEISNDPTEAYFICHLPNRPDEPAWGEYAPCTSQEWLEFHVGVLRGEADIG